MDNLSEKDRDFSANVDNYMDNVDKLIWVIHFMNMNTVCMILYSGT